MYNKLINKDYNNTLENFDDKLGVITLMGDYFVTGSVLGYITLWKDNLNLKMKRCHGSSIDSLFSDNKIIISGGRDKVLMVLDPDLKILRKIDLNFDSKYLINCIPRSIDVFAHEQGEKGIQKILLGTSTGDILELIFTKNILEEENPSIKIYNSSHYSRNNQDNEITSISFLKRYNMFITTCEDKTIRLWNLETKKQNDFIILNEDIKPTCSALSINEEIFAVGFDSGLIKFYSTQDFRVEKEIKESSSPITAIKYSKNYEKFACATQDVKENYIIDIYDSMTYNKERTLLGAQNQINGLDWSKDGKYIVSFSHEKECRIFNVQEKTMISQYSDVDFKEWDTWTICYGWPLKGYYDSKEGKVPIYTCERFKLSENENDIIAVGDCEGRIKLFKYPIINKDQKYISNIIEHGKRATNIKFGKIKNKNIIVSSGSDGCLIAWVIE
jgi:WD40 repeat protein